MSIKSYLIFDLTPDIIQKHHQNFSRRAVENIL